MKINCDGKILEYNDINDPFFTSLVEKCAPNCMAAMVGSFEVLYGVYNNIKYISENNIPGDIVECGVWRGGLMQLAALALTEFGDTSRRIYMYDTFEGMPKPGEKDFDWNGEPAIPTWEHYNSKGKKWAFGGDIDQVRETMGSTNYPADKLILVKGLVEQTIPNCSPSKIALLRLDTDFYSSTAHELVYLFPLLSVGGILVIDDYGYYLGAREATDEYFKNNNIRMHLSRVSAGGVREGVKQ